MKSVLFHPAASEEFEEAVSFYETQQAGLGKNLREEVEKAVAQIRHLPSIGSRYRETAIQQWTLRRFPYRLFYLETPQVIWIIAVAHGKRSPGCWRNRTINTQ